MWLDGSYFFFPKQRLMSLALKCKSVLIRELGERTTPDDRAGRGHAFGLRQQVPQERIVLAAGT
jgi:hypothetical protein